MKDLFFSLSDLSNNVPAVQYKIEAVTSGANGLTAPEKAKTVGVAHRSRAARRDEFPEMINRYPDSVKKIEQIMTVAIRISNNPNSPGEIQPSLPTIA
jgi:hypothetical protein